MDVEVVHMSNRKPSGKEASERSSWYCVILACCVFSFSPVKSALIQGLRTVVTLPFHLDTVLCYAVLVYFAFRAAPFILRQFPWEEIIPFLVLYAYALISLYMAQDAVALDDFRIQVILDLLKASLAYYVLFRVCPKDEAALRYIGVAALVGIVAQYLNVAVWYDFTEATYSQSMGYQTLPVTIVCVMQVFHARGGKGRAVYVIAAFAGLFCLVSCGARGPLLIFLICVVANVFFGFTGGMRSRLAVSLMVLAILLVAFINLDQIVAWFQGMLNSAGFSSRLVSKYENGELLQDSSRRTMAGIALDYISNHVLVGSGIGNDRAIIASGLSSSEPYGNYPHNIILEILMQFGLLLGVVLVLALVVLLVNALMKGNSTERMLMGILICAGLLPLLVSGSYTDWPLFFALLGCAASVLRKPKVGIAVEQGALKTAD